MTLKLLHTSDWHLGASLFNASRAEEHARFLDWLLDVLRAEAIDVLLIAGDVFDHAQPSAEALQLYYHFLARTVGIETLRKVVVVGGNHDAASRIDAPGEVLEALRVHVVGGLGGDEAGWQRCLCPIHGDDGEVLGVVLGVPFVHEFRLGVRTTRRHPAEIAVELRNAFTHLYTTLVDAAAARWPGVALAATGHLTCQGARAGDFHTEIHHYQMLGGLPPEAFDPRLDYVALGHIHRPYAVDADASHPRVWYSGSPVALDAEESRVTRRVLRVTLEGPDAPAVVDPIEVPVWRPIVELDGAPDEVAARLEALTWDTPLPPLIYADLRVERHTPGAAQTLLEVLQRREDAAPPRIVRVRQLLIDAPDDDDVVEVTGRALRDLTPEEVFVALHRQRRKREPTDALLEAFRSLLSPDQDEAPAQEPT